MSFSEKEVPTVGELIADASAQLSAHRCLVAAYLAVCIPLDVASNLISAGHSEALRSLALPVSLGLIVAQYFLFEALLGANGLIERGGGKRILRFFGLGFLTLFGVMLAATLLFVPAFIVAARWLAAPCFLVATEDQVFASLGSSWSMTQGRTTPVALALLVLGVAYLMIVGSLRTAAETTGLPLLVVTVEGITGEAAWAAVIALSVAVFARLSRRSSRYAEVFA